MITKCPGLYCGRQLFENGTYSDCGACPRGSRVIFNHFECALCTKTPPFYDWMYLLFMVLLLVLIEIYTIDHCVKRRKIFTLDIMPLYVCSIIENLISAIITLLIMEPMGKFTLYSCGARRLADWYTLFFNPVPGYASTMRCTQEAVYPYYSIVFVHYTLALASLLIIRPLVPVKRKEIDICKTIYLTMYAIPALAIIHAIFAGVIYYSYPYVTIVGSLVSVAWHLACRLNQEPRALLIDSVKEPRYAIILLGHFVLHGFGIIGLTEFNNPLMTGLLLLLTPFPTCFYILTAKFTDPSKLEQLH